jgi:hypothetical protein
MDAAAAEKFNFLIGKSCPEKRQSAASYRDRKLHGKRIGLDADSDSDRDGHEAILEQ